MMQKNNNIGYSNGKTKTYLVFIGAIFIVIVLVLGFTSILNVMSFRQSYTDYLVRSYALAGKEAVKKIEYAVKYGKPLDRFFGIHDLLGEVNEALPEIDNVTIIGPDGKVMYGYKEEVQNTIGEGLKEEISKFSVHSDIEYITYNENHSVHILIPVYNVEKTLQGTLDVVFFEKVIQSKIDSYIYNLIFYMMLLALASVILISFIYRLSVKLKEKDEIDRRVLMRVMLGVLAFIQIIFGYVNYSMFKSGYMDITKETASMALNIVQRDVETVISKGVPYTKLYDIEDYLDKILVTIPQIENIQIIDSENNCLYTTLSDENTYDEIGNKLTVTLRPDNEGKVCSIIVSLSSAIINRSVRGILLDAVTIIIVSFFFMIEIILMVIGFIGKKHRDLGGKDLNNVQGGMVRPLAFIVYGVVFLTAAFVPVIMGLIYKPLFGLSRDFVLGLPVSAEMFCGLAATLAAGFIIDKRGWKVAFSFGILLFIAGTVMSGIVSTPVLYIVARGLAGAGFGALIMSMRALVISSAGSTGIADMNAGATAGVNCGVVTGGMLADRIGFDKVFYISALLAVLAFLLALWGISNSVIKNQKSEKGKTSIIRFILNKQVFGFFLLILIPFSICAMFLNYYFPIYANNIGISSSDVGRAFMVNGLCIVYLGPLLSKYFKNAVGNKKALIISVLLTSAAILIFASTGSIVGAVVALLLIGISDSFGVSAQIGDYMNIDAAKEAGEGKAVAYYSIIGKLGQMLGPITFAAVSFQGTQKGVGIIAIGVVIALGIYMIFVNGKRIQMARGG